MARARNIKPGFFINEDLTAIEPLGRILFAGLWCLADREGRLEDRPGKIKLSVLPADSCDVDMLLSVLAEKGFIIRYQVENKKYIQVVNFTEHQNPHHTEKKSVIPSVPQECNGELQENNGELTVKKQECNGEYLADSLIPDSLIPDSLIPDSAKPDEKQRDIDSKIKLINDKAMHLGLNGVSPELLLDAEERLKEGTDTDLIIKALGVGITKGTGGPVPKCRYAIKVLQGWAAEGIKTLDQWKAKYEPKAVPKEVSHSPPLDKKSFSLQDSIMAIAAKREAEKAAKEREASEAS